MTAVSSAGCVNTLRFKVAAADSKLLLFKDAHESPAF
jgi:hypothetical protein